MVAMANCRGGRIVLSDVICSSKLLDSSHLDNLVNAQVSPRINGITWRQLPDGDWEIEADRSPDRPHVFVVDRRYKDDEGKDKYAFHRGQVYVRHSSKSEPATG
jgi:hypothetical protein